MVSGLMTRGVDVHHADRDGRTALFAACANGHADYIPVIINAGGKTDVLDSMGQNVIHAAANHGSVIYLHNSTS